MFIYTIILFTKSLNCTLHIVITSYAMTVRYLLLLSIADWCCFFSFPCRFVAVSFHDRLLSHRWWVVIFNEFCEKVFNCKCAHCTCCIVDLTSEVCVYFLSLWNLYHYDRQTNRAFCRSILNFIECPGWYLILCW